MGKPNDKGHFAVFLRQISNCNYLNGTEERHKPRMVVPGALVFRISEIGVFQFLKIFFDYCEGQGVWLGFVSLDQWHDLAAVVPG